LEFLGEQLAAGAQSAEERGLRRGAQRAGVVAEEERRAGAQRRMNVGEHVRQGGAGLVDDGHRHDGVGALHGAARLGGGRARRRCCLGGRRRHDVGRPAAARRP